MKYIVVIILISISFIVNGQNNLSENTNELSGIPIKDKPNYKQANPYIFDDFLEGVVYFKDNNNPLEYKLNYDAFDDQLEYLKNDEKFIATNPDNILRVNINDEILVYKKFYNFDETKNGFFFEIIDDYISLYKREIIISTLKEKNIYKDDEVKNSELIKKKPQYYISIYGESLRLIKNKKKLLLAFYNHPAIEEFIKKEKIKLHKEKDLIELITFINNFDKNK